MRSISKNSIKVVVIICTLIACNSLFAQINITKNNLVQEGRGYFAGIIYKFENGEFGLIQDLSGKPKANEKVIMPNDTIFTIVNKTPKVFLVMSKIKANNSLKYVEISEIYDVATFFKLKEINVSTKNIKIIKFPAYEGGDNQFAGFAYSKSFDIQIGGSDIKTQKKLKSLNHSITHISVINKNYFYEISNEEAFNYIAILKNNKITMLGYYLYP